MHIYEDYAKVVSDGNGNGTETYEVSGLVKVTKTKTINYSGFKRTVKYDDVKISPRTYWNIGNYDRQFEGRDANCYLCGSYHIDYSKCKCKSYFTIQEHFLNVPKAKRGYLEDVCYNSEKLKQYLPAIKLLSDQQIEETLYENGVLMIGILSWSMSIDNRNAETNRMEQRILNIISWLTCKD